MFFWFVKYLSFFVHKLRLKEIFLLLVLLQIYDGLHWGIENLDRLIIFVKDWFIDYHVRFVLNPKNMTNFLASKITMIEDNKFMQNKGFKKKSSIYFEFILVFRFWLYFFSCLLILPCFLGLFFVLITLLLQFMVFQKVQID